jgi:hypothetical protein
VAVWMTEAPPEVTPSDRPRKRVVVIAIDDGRLKTNGAARCGVCLRRGPSRRRSSGPGRFGSSRFHGARQDRSELQVSATSTSEGAVSRPARAITFVFVRSPNQPHVVGYRALATDAGGT